MFMNENKNDYKMPDYNNPDEFRRTRENIDDLLGSKEGESDKKTSQSHFYDDKKERRMKILSGKTQYRPSIDVDDINSPKSNYKVKS
jgi:hypothetical protein